MLKYFHLNQCHYNWQTYNSCCCSERIKRIYIYIFNSSAQYFIHCCLVVGNGCEKLLSTITADRGPCFSMEICGSHKSTTHHPHCGWWLGKNMRNLSCCKFFMNRNCMIMFWNFIQIHKHFCKILNLFTRHNLKWDICFFSRTIPICIISILYKFNVTKCKKEREREDYARI